MAPAARLTAAAAALALAAAAAPTVQLDAFGTNSIRVRIVPPGNALVDPPIAALNLAAPPAADPASVRRHALGLDVGNLRVTSDPATGYVTATRISDGAVLLQQTALALAAPASPGTKPGSVAATITFAGHAGETFVGLGEHDYYAPATFRFTEFVKVFETSTDYAQSRGGDVSIPWYASSMGYGFVWNSPAYGYVNLSSTALEWSADATLNVDFWVTVAPAGSANPTADLLSQYVDAVGHATTMPYYATGFIQCKDRYRNQTQLLDVARGYVERGLPISTIVIDWQHWVHIGDWTFNPACWPDPQGMVDELQSLGIQPMVTFWPLVAREATHWANFTADGYIVGLVNGSMVSYDSPGGDQYLTDDTNPAAREAIFDAFWAGYGKYGFKTIWLDAAEPEHFGNALQGQWKLSAGTDAEVGMGWVKNHVQTFSDGFAKVGITGAEYFVLPRSGWAGTWAHSAALWSGDISSDFGTFAIQIKVLQQAMLSGVALWTTDIGGYTGGNPSDPVFQELIVRWFQFGAFCPLFRLHGHRGGGPPSNQCGPTNGDNEVWNLAPAPDHYDAIVAVMRLREDLREYVSQINAVTAATGLPMVRPMFLQYPADPGCQGADVEDQFMFGPDWLVAPVYTQGATSRSVYLPRLTDGSHEWVYWWNQSSVGAGGGRITWSSPSIGEFPLYVIRPVAPAVLADATSLFSTARSDSVLCVVDQCTSANTDYAKQRVEGAAVAATADGGASITLNGTAYPVAPLTLWFSFTHNDNFVATNTTPPDASYTPASGGVTFANGYVLTTQAPGSVPLQVWFKDYDGANWDYATVAQGAGSAWAQGAGYSFLYTTGYVLPPQ